MTKDLFITTLNSYKRYKDYENKMADLGMNLWEREEIQDVMLSLFEVIYHDCKEEYEDDDLNFNIIDSFVFEHEFGKTPYKVEENIVINTIEELWDYLVSIHPEINEE